MAVNTETTRFNAAVTRKAREQPQEGGGVNTDPPTQAEISLLCCWRGWRCKQGVITDLAVPTRRLAFFTRWMALWTRSISNRQDRHEKFNVYHFFMAVLAVWNGPCSQCRSPCKEHQPPCWHFKIPVYSAILVRLISVGVGGSVLTPPPSWGCSLASALLPR